VIQISPENPTSSDEVTILAEYSGCIQNFGISQAGPAFAGFIHYQGSCFSTPPGGFVHFNVGKLAAGNYVVTVDATIDAGGVIIPSSVVHQTAAFSVAESASAFPLPTIEPFGLALIALLILATARRFFWR
jgi:hypothetical protein